MKKTFALLACVLLVAGLAACNTDKGPADLATVPGTGLLAYTDCRSPTNGFIHLWHVARRAAVRSLPVPGMPRHLAASPDGSRVACSLQWPDRRTLVLSLIHI